jgi:ACT domain-containing protein
MVDEIEQKLTEKQKKAIVLIIEAKSISEGVKKSGISRTIFYEWMKTPQFKLEFIRLRKEVIELALHDLKASTGEAVKVLRQLLNAKNEGIRLRAALGMIEHIAKFIQFEEFEQRISELEKRATN